MEGPALPPPDHSAAIASLEELKRNTENEEWVIPEMKRAILTGVVLCIQKLRNETTKR
jgi:hypothetical protein